VSPRTASLQVSHSSWCPNRTKTSLTSVDRSCKAAKCKPRYFTLHRGEGPDGRPTKIRGERFSDRQVAEKALRKLQVQIDEERAGIVREKDVTFREWAETFTEIAQRRVELGTMKPRTLQAYRETLTLYATPVLGSKVLRRIGAPELRAFFDATTTTVNGEQSSTASRIRHLRQLSVMFSAAVDEGLLPANPVPVFIKKLKLRAPKRGKAPFEDGELLRLWAVYDAKVAQKAKPWQPVYRYATEFAAEAGLRIGELVALDLENLRGAELRVTHTYSPDGLVAPKDGEPRTVYLTNEALAVLAAWLPLRGDEDGPLFPNPKGGRLTIREVQRRLERAMEAAGIPTEHPELGLPRSFHSLRYTTSNLMQRRGYHPRLIEQNLGHSSLELTYGVYGGWTPEQMRQEAARATT
jgi:integrase